MVVNQIATFEFDIQSDGDSVEDDDNYMIQFDTFLHDNLHLANIIGLAIQTGYTHRIIQSSEMLRALKPAVVFTDKHWEKDLNPFIGDKTLYKFMQGIYHSGTCVFAEKESIALFDYVSKLSDMDYCGFCYNSSLYKIEWYEQNNQKLMLAYMDCESG